MRLRRRKSRDEEIQRELDAHLELEAQEQRDDGMTSEQARHAALRAFGNVTRTKEEVRRMWSWARWEILMQDIRYAARALSKHPGFALTAILTLALGIGASTAVFTVVDSVVLKPLAFRDSGRLVALWERPRFLGGDAVGPNPRHVEIWRERNTAFSGMTFLRHMSMGLTIEGDRPRRVGTVACLPNLFDVLQVSPALGRLLIAQDGEKGRDGVVVLTHAFWQSEFRGDQKVIGKTIRLDDVPRVVVGVLPAGFHFPNANALRAFRPKQPLTGVVEPALFFPVAFDLKEFSFHGSYGNWVTLARLKPGVTVAAAETQLNAIQEQVVQHPENKGDRRPGALAASVQPMQEAVVGESATRLWLLMAAVMGLMLIACLNLANTQLGRALARRRESAVRSALGAGRWRLLWSSLAENLVLAIAGGAAGVAFAAVGLELFRSYSPVDLPRLSEVRLNVTVLLFSLGLTITASLLFGLMPAVRLVAADPQAFLQQNTNRAIGGTASHRLRTWLIGFQAFGCTALLLLTGLFSKSLLHLLSQDKGIETARVSVAEVSLSPKLYGADPRRIAFIDGVLGNLRALPGVQSAGLVSAMPFEGERWIEPLQRVDRPNQEGPLVNARWASPGYFEATGQKLVAGRFFEDRDRNLSTVILSEGEAKVWWGNENPIGGQVRVLGRRHTVIGVVADTRNTSLKTDAAKMAYVHYSFRTPFTPYFVVRSSQSAAELVPKIREVIWSHAPDVTVVRVKTLDAQLSDSLAPERFQTFVLIAFGVSALLLAMLGIYGVLSYWVATRKQEIGVRMALGASRSLIYRLTVSEAAWPVLLGLASGLIASVLAGRIIQKLLYGTQVVDPPVILIVTGLFLVSALAAAYLPARRAASVDPMDALRSE
jgi:predicted permease